MGKGTEVRRGKSHRGTTELSKGRALALQGGTQAQQRNGGVMVRGPFPSCGGSKTPKESWRQEGLFLQPIVVEELLFRNGGKKD